MAARRKTASREKPKQGKFFVARMYQSGSRLLMDSCGSDAGYQSLETAKTAASKAMIEYARYDYKFAILQLVGTLQMPAPQVDFIPLEEEIAAAIAD